MKNWPYLTLACFLLTSGIAAADYLIIKVDLNKEYLKNPQGQGPGMPGAPPGEGGYDPAAGGGYPGMPMSSPGGPGGIPPKGMPGYPPPGSSPMGPMMPPGYPAPPGTMPGQPGSGPAEPETAPFWAYAFVEIKGKPKYHPKMFSLEIDHQWGKMNFIPAPFIARYIQREPLKKEYDKRFKKDKEAKNINRLLTLAQWTLAHGMKKAFHAVMEEAQKIDGKHPAVVAYNKVKAALKVTPADEDPTLKSLLADLKSEGYRSALTEKNHYQLLHNLPPNPGSELILKQRLARMEDTLENFFYWFALQGQVNVPPVPKRRLVAILINNPKEFQAKHVFWGSQPMAVDGFTPRRDNLMVLSTRRLDDTFTLLEKNTQTEWNALRVARDELLSGEIWKTRIKKDQALGQQWPKLILIQAQTLMQKVLEEDAERATISHEGTRQLLYATGLLPRNVLGPEWLPAGLASFFETSQDAFYTSSGLPSWKHLINFKHYRKTGKLGQSQEVLFNLITDRYFRQMQRSAQDLAETTDDREKLVVQAKEDAEIARSAAWAFVYYLAQQKDLPKLLRFCQEINNLPRDLEFDENIWLGCFARSFAMADRNDSNRLDMVEFQRFADSWFAEMEKVSLEMAEVERDVLQWRSEGSAPRRPPRPARPANTNTPGPPPGPSPGGP